MLVLEGDGTEAITSGEIRAAIPRIIMGIVIAITISKPVELRIFKTEVDVKLQEERLAFENIKNVKVQFGENIDFAEAEILRLKKGQR